jgi:H+-translocating NAD(P) transhydrogenase subunit beta
MDSSLQLMLDLAIVLILLLGLWQFRTPRGALRGNLTAAFALLCALATVLCRHPVHAWAVVLCALAIGSLVGGAIAFRVNMIQIPAMVAFQHGAGGVAAFLVSAVELTRDPALLTPVGRVSGLLGVVIGAATFSGSMLAAAKLANRMKQTPRSLPGHNGLLLGLLLALAILAAAGWGALGGALLGCLLGLVLVAVALGVLFAMRIGGADMPVLISFLNATAGIAAAFCGIIIQNRLLIACGATVAASGSILTRVMCVAMNRDLFQVLAGIRPKLAASPSSAPPPPASVAATAAPPPPLPPAPADTRPALERAIAAATEARRVIVIPGYGMALAQAQFEVMQLAKRLEAMGKEVRFAIHPVAGRMPGHMNVLLAEAEVDYDKLCEMDVVNPLFAETDLALIVGACDVVNPAATDREGTPISGMPILLAHQAKAVIVCNLDAKPGYSGVDNPLYEMAKTVMLLGDAKAMLGDLLRGLGGEQAG